jgi:hypothetical protein
VKACSFQDNKQLGERLGSRSEAQQRALDGSLGDLEIILEKLAELSGLPDATVLLGRKESDFLF